MANTLYDNARRAFASAEIDWIDDTFKVILVTESLYTFQAGQVDLTSIGESARNFGDEGIAGASLTNSNVAANGAVYGDNVRFTSVLATSPVIDAIVVYKDTGTASTSPLIYWADTATGLPITPNGGDIIVTWNTGTNRIFRL